MSEPADADWYDEGVTEGCTTRHGRLIADNSKGGTLISRDAADAEGLLLRSDIGKLPKVDTQLNEVKESV